MNTIYRDDPPAILLWVNEYTWIIAGVIFVALGILIGIKIHKNVTPSIEGTYVGQLLFDYESKSIPIRDEIIINNNDEKSAQIIRSFDYSVDNRTIRVTIKSNYGRWKEKHNCFILKFGDFDYISSDNPTNINGKTIKAKAYMDKKIKIEKDNINDRFVHFLYKRKNPENEDWVDYSFNKTK